MPRVVFTPNLERHLASPPAEVAAGTVREALEAVFEEHPALRGYVLNDQAELRQHVVVFVDGTRPAPEVGLDAPVTGTSEIYVMQALSGG